MPHQDAIPLTVLYNHTMPHPEPLPEFQPHCTDYLTRLCAQQIVGFVLRQAQFEHLVGAEPGFNFNDYNVALGQCISVMTKRRGRGGEPDCGQHRDTRHHLAPPSQHTVNISATIEGVADWTITAADGQPPLAYTARLQPGDSVVLIDYLVEHNVETVSEEREYSSGLYTAVQITAP